MNPQGTTPPTGATPPHGDGASNSPTNGSHLPALLNKVNQQELAMLDTTHNVMRSILKELEQPPAKAEAKASAPTDQDPVRYNEDAATLCAAVSDLLRAEQQLRVCLLEAGPLDAGGDVWRQRALEAQRRAMAGYAVKRVKLLETLAEDSEVARVLLQRGTEGELPESRIARD